MITKKAGTLRPFASQLKDGLLELFYFKANFWSPAFISERIRIFNFKPRVANVILQVDKRDGRTNIKILLATLVLVLFLISVKQNAFAQQVDQNANQHIKNVLSVSPAIIDIDLKKGSKQIYQIKIKNLLNQPLGIRTSIGSFNPTDEESGINFSTHSPLIDYSKLSTDSLIINEGQTKSFYLTINSPKNLKDGGYYEAIFLVPFYLKDQTPESPTILTQVGILVFGNVGTINYQNLSQKVKILDLKAEDDKQNLIPLIRVQNSYFNHFSAKPFLKLTPLFGKSQRFELTEKKILPGKIRRWEEEIKPKSKSVIYKADLAVSVGQGNYVYKNTYFILFPFKKAILLSILILFVIFIYIRKKQIRKAIQVVISGK